MRATLAVAALIALPSLGAATVSESDFKPIKPHCTAPVFREWSARVWRLKNWERGMPPKKTIEAQRRRLSCAPPGHKKAMKHAWREDKSAYFEYRGKMLWLEEYKPFVYPSGKRWAVPYPIAICESGENYYVGPSGAYGLIPPFPQWLSPKRQDEIAHNLYLEQGEGPWAPYESGCYLR